MNHLTDPARRGRALCLLLGVLLGGVGVLPASAGPRYTVGQTVKFDLVTADTRPLSSADLSDRVVAVTFWQSTSEHCLAAMPHLREVFERYTPQGLAMVSISVDDDPAAADGVAAMRGMEWILAHNIDQDKPINAQFFTGQYGVPHAFLLAPGGELVWEGHAADLGPEVEDALAVYLPDYASVVAGQSETPAVSQESAAAIAMQAYQAVFSSEPDFHQLFLLIESLPEDTHTLADVKKFGRSIARSLSRLDPQQQSNYDLYREAKPEVAAQLDRWLEKSRQSISDIDASRNQPSVNPAVVARRFEEAEQAEADGDLLTAYDHYRWIVNRAPASDEAVLAQDVVIVLESDPAFMAQRELAAQEQKARELLIMAQNYQGARLEDKAKETFLKIIQDYPNTQAAEQARIAIDE
ncbi:MAG: redoxin domain-containing protein [Planctomycetota bacterium]